MYDENLEEFASCPIRIKKKESTAKKVLRIILNTLAFIIDLIILIFLICVTFEIMAHFCPNVPEKLPNWFKIVEKVLSIYDSFFKFIISFFKNIFIVTKGPANLF